MKQLAKALVLACSAGMAVSALAQQPAQPLRPAVTADPQLMVQPKKELDLTVMVFVAADNTLIAGHKVTPDLQKALGNVFRTVDSAKRIGENVFFNDRLWRAYAVPADAMPRLAKLKDREITIRVREIQPGRFELVSVLSP